MAKVILDIAPFSHFFWLIALGALDFDRALCWLSILG